MDNNGTTPSKPLMHAFAHTCRTRVAPLMASACLVAGATMGVGWSGAASAQMYVYELPSGARMITDHPLNNSQYRLVRKSASAKGMGAWVAAKKPQTALIDVNAYDDLIHKVARTHLLDPALLKAVMHAESGFNPHAVSHKGASGLMQLMPATAKRFGARDVFDPRENIRAGASFLKYLMKKFDNNHRLVLAAYNAGENAVLRYKGIPPYAETRGYVKKVLMFKGRYAAFARKGGKGTKVATLDASSP